MNSPFYWSNNKQNTTKELKSGFPDTGHQAVKDNDTWKKENKMRWALQLPWVTAMKEFHGMEQESELREILENFMSLADIGVQEDWGTWNSQGRVPKRKELHRERTQEAYKGFPGTSSRILNSICMRKSYLTMEKNYPKGLEDTVPVTQGQESTCSHQPD